jgi:hypothetical protein
MLESQKIQMCLGEIKPNDLKGIHTYLLVILDFALSNNSISSISSLSALASMTNRIGILSKH